jgi:thiamine pyrophosphokinase
VHLISSEAEYHLFSGELALSLRKDTTLSVFAPLGRAEGVTLQGMRYPLRDFRLDASSRGLSNRSQSQRVVMRARKGVLLVILP